MRSCQILFDFLTLFHKFCPRLSVLTNFFVAHLSLLQTIFWSFLYLQSLSRNFNANIMRLHHVKVLNWTVCFFVFVLGQKPLLKPIISIYRAEVVQKLNFCWLSTKCSFNEAWCYWGIFTSYFSWKREKIGRHTKKADITCLLESGKDFAEIKNSFREIRVNRRLRIT